MNRWLIAYVMIFSLVFALVPQPIFANTVPIKVVLDGDELPFSVDPVLEGNRVLVPFRNMLEVLGADVHWQGETGTVTAQKEGISIQLAIGSRTAIVDGNERQLDVSARMINGYTFVPLRFISESLGARVLWEQWELTVYIFSEPRIAIEPVMKKWEYSTIQHVPASFAGYGWMEPSHIIGTAPIGDGPGTTVYATDPNGSPLFPLAEPLDHFAVSADGRTMAWTDQQKIWIRNGSDLDSKADSIDIDRCKDEFSYLGPLLFSPNGKQLLISSLHEWDTNYCVLDLESEDVERLSTRLDGYFLTHAVGWLHEKQLLFTTRASVDLQGQQEYGSGYRQDLAVYDLNANTYGQLTSVADRTFLSPLVIMGEQKILVREENRGETQSDRLWIYDGIDGSRQETGFSAVQALMHPDGTTVALITEIRSEGWNHRYVIALWDRDTGTVYPFLTVIGNELKWSWSPDGNQLLISHVVSELKDREHALYTEMNLTHIIYKQQMQVKEMTEMK